MRLTTFSDYALRVLIYAASVGDRLITIEETASKYQVSRGHLMKVVNMLARHGYIRGVRGRSGGFTLDRPPEEIHLGEILRLTEPDFGLVECFVADSKCAITHTCRLPEVLNEALGAFIATLERYTLADILLTEQDFVPPPKATKTTRGPRMPAPKRLPG